VSYRHWALPKERLFPIDTPELVKTAAAAFDGQVDEMTAAQRLVCSRHICKRASDLGVRVESSLAYKYASSRLSPFFAQFLALRKEASAHSSDKDLDRLLEIARHFDSKRNAADRVAGLDKVAMALAEFDDKHGVSDVPDAAYSVYGQTADRGERLRMVVKVADRHVSSEELDAADFSVLRGKLDDDIVNGLSSASGEERLAVFASLPDPCREIVYQNLFS